MLPWMGDSRLLLATEEGPIFCVGLDDELVSQFLGPYPGLRIVAAAGNAVAAVTGDRQRVVVWHAWDGKMPATDLYLYGLARHRITELIFM
jgi:hypothetical protein